MIESFRTWGSDFPESIQRWQTARARPMLHITTADNNDGHEIITPRAIAQGGGDEYLIRLNRLFSEKEMRAYIGRWASPTAASTSTPPTTAPAPRARRPTNRAGTNCAFRRIYVIVHGGGKAQGDQPAPGRSRAAAAQRQPRRLAEGAGGGRLEPAPVRLADGAPEPARVTSTRARRWVDWVGTDFYASYPEWKSLTGLYNRYPDKPFALTEWGVEAGDDPAFVSKLFAWVEKHPRCKMLVYYQDFGEHQQLPDPELPEPASACSRDRLHSGLPFPAPRAPGGRASSPTRRHRPGLSGCSAVMLE